MSNLNQNIEPPEPINAEAFAEITPDGLEASIRISPPENGGSTLTYELLKIFLARNRIVFGLNEETLQTLGKQPAYNSTIVVARGVPSENGVDARLIYHIDTDRRLKPREREDGSVDFKDLGAIQEAKQGQLLCEKIAANPGKAGTDVRGAPLPYVAGKDINLPVGQNTVMTADRLKLYATVDGHITVMNGKINVLNVYTVNGNVSVETGNIDFSGNVVVRGDVASGFSIRADGDITINGVAEAATITAGGTLVIRGGFLGGDSGVLNVTGNTVCKFIEGGQVNVGGDLETTYIMNATVKCGGAVTLVGRGLIRGGYVSARTAVTANLIGSSKASSSSTTIELGSDPELLQKHEQLKLQTEQMSKNITNLKTVISAMEKAKSAGVLAADKLEQLAQAKTMLENLQPASEAMRIELESLERQAARTGRGTVNAKRTAYSGLKLIMGNETLILQHDHDRVSFYNGQDGITFVPLLSEFA